MRVSNPDRSPVAINVTRWLRSGETESRRAHVLRRDRTPCRVEKNRSNLNQQPRDNARMRAPPYQRVAASAWLGTKAFRS